jgi:hypothetical protein
LGAKIGAGRPPRFAAFPGILPVLPRRILTVIGPELPVNILQKTLQCAASGIDGLKVSSDQRDSHTLYIGAYSYEPYTAMTEQLGSSLAADGLTWAELRQLVKSDEVSYAIQVNNFLSRSSEIIANLDRESVRVYGTFGYTKPAKFVIAIGPEFPIDVLQKTLQVCLESGLEGLKLVSDPRNFHAAYVGAYGYGQYTPITKQLSHALLVSSLTWPELRQLVKSD